MFQANRVEVRFSRSFHRAVGHRVIIQSAMLQPNDAHFRAEHVRPTTAGNTFHADLAPDLRS